MRPSRWMVLTVAYLFYLSTLAFSAEVRKVTRQDIEWTTGARPSTDCTVTSAGGHVGNVLDNTYYLSSPWVDVRAYASVNAAVTDIGATDNTILISTAQTLTASLTIPANVTVFFVGAGKIVKASTYTLTMNGKIVAPPAQQIFSGFAAGDVTINSATNPTVFPDWWQGNTTPGTTNMSTALTSAVQSGVKHIKLLGTKYAYTGLTIPDGTSDLTIEGSAVEYGANSTQLWYTPTSGNGLYFAGEADYFTIKNLTFNAHGAESDTVCIANIIGAGKVLRSPTFENIHIYGWLGGIRIGFAMRARIIGGYFSGQGQAVADGVGILMGWDGADSTNVAVIRDAWITGYKTGVWNKYSTTLDIYSTDISLATTGLKADVGVTYVYDSYFESNITAIDTSVGGYLYGNWTLTNVTGPNPGTITVSGTHRFGRNGYGQARIVGYRNAAWSLNGGPTIIPFDAEYDDTEGDFSIATGVFTAGFAGFYDLAANVTFTATDNNQAFNMAFYKDNVVIPHTGAVFHSVFPSLDNTFGGVLVRTIWLNRLETIDVRATTSANLAINRARVDISSKPW